MKTDDPTRVTLICRCGADYAEGYGATIEEADANVRKFWRNGGHRKRDVTERCLEWAVPVDGGGSRYEEVARAEAGAKP